MMNEDRNLESFARAVEALEPYLEDVVFVGGWAHFLYTLRPEASPVDFEPLRTEDADVAVPLRLTPSNATISDRLRQAGFREHLSGDLIPPISAYVLGDDASGFFLEFLSPLVGAEIDRAGRRRSTRTIGGVSTQALRYLDVLFDSPWSVALSRGRGFPLKHPQTVSIPNPVSYIVQKMLVMKRRPPTTQSKDLLYVHDTFAIFSDSLDSLGSAWESLRERMPSSYVRSFEKAANEILLEMGEPVRRAARIAGTRASAPTPELLFLGLRLGFSSAFGLSPPRSHSR